MAVAPSDRLRRLPPYLFAEMERKKRALVEAGTDVIDLGIGDPDQPPPRRLIESFTGHLDDPGVHGYSPSHGIDEYRDGVAAWMKGRYGTALKRTEICLAVGSKELIAHAPMALTNPGDVVLVPEPGYPPYRSGTIFALCEPYLMPLKKENGFRPDLDAIPPDVAARAKILYVNFPNNPTGAVADAAFYTKCVAFAKKHDVTIISDAAYGELYYDDADRPMSFLEVPGAKEVGVEVHSMTKTFNMAGWRIAWVAGNPDVVETLRAFKANCDSGQFMAVQKAVADVLRGGGGDMKSIREMYRGRRDVMVDGLKKIGWDVAAPRATFYLWFPVPDGGPSMDFAGRMMEKAGIVVTPGVGFGPSGEGFLRIALTVPEDRLREAVDRISGM
ncbi:MAG: LL-diaminopimelate aminotransferase [Planctomycetota bacterium]|jgi:LL-diaminopimelate aminotransferase